MNVTVSNGLYYLQEKAFTTADLLVQHYAKEDVPNTDKIKHIRLLHPIIAVAHNGPNGKWVDLAHAAPHRRNTLPELGSKKESDALKRAASQHSRPPEPLPREHAEWIRSIEPPSASPSEDDKKIYDYSTVDNLNKSGQLEKDLKMMNICGCGLQKSESVLPYGWTVHRSMESATNGMFFFVSPENTSSWVLPDNVRKAMDNDQLKYLRLNADH